MIIIVLLCILAAAILISMLYYPTIIIKQVRNGSRTYLNFGVDEYMMKHFLPLLGLRPDQQYEIAYDFIKKAKNINTKANIMRVLVFWMFAGIFLAWIIPNPYKQTIGPLYLIVILGIMAYLYWIRIK
jgi:hypothetical protein